MFCLNFLHVQALDGPRREKTCLQGLRTTKAQTSLCSLINAFVIHLLESFISRLNMREISIFLLVSVAERLVRFAFFWKP